MKIVNLTPHTINETTTGQNFAPSGIVARAKQSTYEVANHAGIPVFSTTFGAIQGLPEPEEGTIYIVSSLALTAIPKTRTDIVAPGNLQRDQDGKPIGCCGFRINS